MPSPTRPGTQHLTKRQRRDQAVKACMDGTHNISEAARQWGWNRTYLSKLVSAERKRVAAEIEAARDKLDSAAERAAAAEAARAGLSPLGLGEHRRVPVGAEFQRLYFGHLSCYDCGVPHPLPDFHVEELEVIRDPRNRVAMILQPPGHAKTSVVTVRDLVNDVCLDPNTLQIVVSQSAPFARALLAGVSELLTNNEIYAGAARNPIEDWGPFKPESREGKWSATELYVAGRQTAEPHPTVLAIGLGNQIYGRRAHKIRFDDIATLKNQENPDQVLKQLEWIDKEALSRVGANTGRAIFCGTRIRPDDIYATLLQRDYLVVRYPCILDENAGTTLWPDHFPIEAALARRETMRSRQDWELVYQQVDVPGAGMSFPWEVIEPCLDGSRVAGEVEQGWFLVLGLDPAGANRDSGYTAFVLLGVDPRTGYRYLVEASHHLQMKAPELKSKIFDFADRYPQLREIRVESNGVQAQIVQYNEEITLPLARRGVRVTPHFTHSHNKTDSVFGVETMAPLFHTGQVAIPWGSGPTQAMFKPLVDELTVFPLGKTSDLVMAFWFAELGVRDLVFKANLPMFDERTKRWPQRIRSRRRVIDFASGVVTPVPLRDQAQTFGVSPGRLVAGRMLPHASVEARPGRDPIQLVNMERSVDSHGDPPSARPG